MNPDQPSREHIEARITALLLGELPADEAELLRYTIAQDPALKQLHDELASTIVLVREAMHPSTEATAEKAEPLKLSGDRREKLLAHFQTAPKDEPLFWLPRVSLPQFITALVCIALIGLVAAISIPNFVKARATSQANSVINNLRQIDAAKNQWALENNKSADAVPTAVDLSPYLKNGGVKPVAGETYVIGKVSGPTIAEADTEQARKKLGTAVIRLPVDTSAEMTVATASDVHHTSAPATPAPVTVAAAPLAPAAMPPQSTTIILPPTETSSIPIAYARPSDVSDALAAMDKTPPPVGVNSLPAGSLIGGGGGGASGGTYVIQPGDTLSKIALEHGTTVKALEEANNLSSTKILAGAKMKLPETPPQPGGVYSQQVVGYVNVDKNTGSLRYLGSLAPTPAPVASPSSGTVAFEPPAVDPTTGLPLAKGQGNVNAPNIAGNGEVTAVDQAKTETTRVGYGLASNGDAQNFSGGGGGGLAGVNRWTQNDLHQKIGNLTQADGRLQSATGLPSNSTGATSSLADNATVNTTHVLPDDSGTTLAVNERVVASPQSSPNLDDYTSIVPPAHSLEPSPVWIRKSDGKTVSGDVAKKLDQEAAERQTVAWLDENKSTIVGTSGSAPSIAIPTEQPPTLAMAEKPKDVSADTWDVNSVQQKSDQPVSGLRRLYRAIVPQKKAPRVTMLPGSQALVGSPQDASGTIAATQPAGDFKFDDGIVTNALPVPAGSATQPAPDTMALGDVPAFAGKSSDRDDSVNFKVQPGQFYSGLSNKAIVESKPNTSAVTLAQLPVASEESRKLSDLEQMHKLLESKVKMAKIDYDLPIYTMVQVTDPAEPSKKQTFWQGLKGEYASTATLKVENEGAIINSMEGGQAAQSYTYDPYFIQTTFEIMKSQLVLTNVVNTLDLETKWAPSNGGQKVPMAQALERLKSEIDLKPVRNTKMVAITVTSEDPQEAADIANTIASSYQSYRAQNTKKIQADGLKVLEQQLAAQSNQIQATKAKLAEMDVKKAEAADRPLPKPAPNMPIPQPEVLCTENNFSTFALNVSDVSFQLAAASLEHGQLPDAASIRSEEFINAFDYRDPEAAAGQPLAFVAERARYSFAQNRDLLRFSVKAAAVGRPAGRALNLVVLLDISGSMERADRVAIIHEALRVLASQLQSQDTVSVVTFSRTARLWADGISGDKAGETLDRVGGITPEGGTNLEEAMRLAYATARRHYLANGMNRVVLLTDGAANLGDVDPSVLRQNVETQRKQGIALDCFGVGYEDYNDDLLEQLSSHGDGRYAFLNSPEDASKEFAAKLAGALQIAAQDVKVQVEFNPQRVTSWRQIGYATHQLTKQQFRDNTVAAGEIAAQEAGNALYTVETKPDGTGPVATVHVRYRVPGTQDYQERSWLVDYNGTAPALENSSPAMRLAGTASAFSEWLATSPYAQEVTLDELQKILTGVPQIYGADERPKKLETMLREAKSISGK